jgi:hypothetical protein
LKSVSSRKAFGFTQHGTSAPQSVRLHSEHDGSSQVVQRSAYGVAITSSCVGHDVAGSTQQGAFGPQANKFWHPEEHAGSSHLSQREASGVAITSE